jgi:hypothetical protein
MPPSELTHQYCKWISVVQFFDMESRNHLIQYIGNNMQHKITCVEYTVYSSIRIKKFGQLDHMHLNCTSRPFLKSCFLTISYYENFSVSLTSGESDGLYIEDWNAVLYWR